MLHDLTSPDFTDDEVGWLLKSVASGQQFIEVGGHNSRSRWLQPVICSVMGFVKQDYIKAKRSRKPHRRGFIRYVNSMRKVGLSMLDQRPLEAVKDLLVSYRLSQVDKVSAVLTCWPR